MTKYLVTGGAGFIGSHLVSSLVERGETVRIVDDLSTGKKENLAHLPAGRVAARVLHRATLPVLIVPGPADPVPAAAAAS